MRFVFLLSPKMFQTCDCSLGADCWQVRAGDRQAVSQNSRLSSPGAFALAKYGHGDIVPHPNLQITWIDASHNPEVAGSNPARATKKAPETGPLCLLR